MANLIELLGGIAQGLQTGKEMKRQSVLDQLRIAHEKQSLDLQKAQIRAAEQRMKFDEIDRQRNQFMAQGEQYGNVLEQLGFVPQQSKEQLGQVPQETFERATQTMQGVGPFPEVGQVPVVKKAPKEVSADERYKAGLMSSTEEKAYIERQKKLTFATDKTPPKEREPLSSAGFKAIERQRNELGTRLDRLYKRLNDTSIGEKYQKQRDDLQKQIDALQPKFDQLEGVIAESTGVGGTTGGFQFNNKQDLVSFLKSLRDQLKSDTTSKK